MVKFRFAVATPGLVATNGALPIVAPFRYENCTEPVGVYVPEGTDTVAASEDGTLFRFGLGVDAWMTFGAKMVVAVGMAETKIALPVATAKGPVPWMDQEPDDAGVQLTEPFPVASRATDSGVVEPAPVKEIPTVRLA